MHLAIYQAIVALLSIMVMYWKNYVFNITATFPRGLWLITMNHVILYQYVSGCKYSHQYQPFLVVPYYKAKVILQFIYIRPVNT